MKTAAKPKNTGSSPKKKFIVEPTETALAGIAGSAGDDSGSFLEDKRNVLPSGNGISSEEKQQLIAKAAYYRAEKRNFAAGYEMEDWLSAEAEIEKMLSMIETPIKGHRDGDTKARRSG